MKFKNGFTLSEILITLAVIGVISAMTLPSIINHFQMKSYAVSFKKHYSILQNAINYLQAEEDIRDCYVYYPGGSMYMFKTEDCPGLRSGIINRLSLNEISYDNSIYKSHSDVINESGSVIRSSIKYKDFYKNVKKAYLFKDGAILIFCYLHTANGQGYAYWVLDINGQKGPNKWGYDVFFLTITAGKNGELKLGDDLASLKEKGGYYPNEILLK